MTNFFARKVYSRLVTKNDIKTRVSFMDINKLRLKEITRRAPADMDASFIEILDEGNGLFHFSG
jgi:hypothetical protein